MRRNHPSECAEEVLCRIAQRAARGYRVPEHLPALNRFESNARMGAVAKRLGSTATAAAQLCCRHTRNDTPGATGDLQVAANRQGAVVLWVDGQRTVANRKRIGLAAGWLSRRVEPNLMM
jgi:hypothetical protein